MLIVYLEPLVITQVELLNRWGSFVNYWPRSYVHSDAYSSAIPVDYWLLFSQPLYATQWMLRYPEHSRIVRTLFDPEAP